MSKKAKHKEQKIENLSWDSLRDTADTIREQSNIHLAVMENVLSTKDNPVVKDPALAQEVSDLLKQYTKVYDDIKNIVKQHADVDTDEEGREYIAGWASGTIDPKDEKEYYGYFDIVSKYMNANERLDGLNKHMIQNIYPRVGVFKNDIEQFNSLLAAMEISHEANKSAMEYVKGMENIKELNQQADESLKEIEEADKKVKDVTNG